MINYTGEITPKIFSIITVSELKAGLENKIGVSVSLVVSLAKLLRNSRYDDAVLEHLNFENDGWGGSSQISGSNIGGTASKLQAVRLAIADRHFPECMFSEFNIDDRGCLINNLRTLHGEING